MERIDRLAWRQLGIARGVLLDARRQFYPPGFAFPFHDHDYPEFFLVVSGAGWHDLDGASTPLAPGDLVLVDAASRHRPRAGARTSLGFINVTIAPPFARALLPRLPPLPGWGEGRPRAQRLGPFDHQVALDRLTELERGGGDRIACESLILDLAWRLRRAAGRRDSLPPALAATLERLDGADGLRAGPAALAAAAGCSREHLNRLCRRHLGGTLVDLVGARRLDHAARLLRHTAEPIVDIASGSGFDSLSHFYARFRRRFGCTPAAWRGGGTSAARAS
jgi:AraC family cel operon transcriptional repressor